MGITDRREIILECDVSGCSEEISVSAADRGACNRQLFELGWRLHDNQQLCPFHARRLESRLRVQWEADQPFVESIDSPNSNIAIPQATVAVIMAARHWLFRLARLQCERQIQKQRDLITLEAAEDFVTYDERGDVDVRMRIYPDREGEEAAMDSTVE